MTDDSARPGRFDDRRYPFGLPRIVQPSERLAGRDLVLKRHAWLEDAVVRTEHQAVKIGSRHHACRWPTHRLGCNDRRLEDPGECKDIADAGFRNLDGPCRYPPGTAEFGRDDDLAAPFRLDPD